MRLPALFLSHGAPTLAVEETDETRAWAKLAAELPRPKAILAVSAHWDTDAPMVSTAVKPETIHDFSGFPRALYEQRYPAPGAAELAKRVVELAAKAGMPCASDPSRGLDHGAWVPLKWMYPAADIPVTQLSVQSRRGARHHFDLGKALAPLRDEGVLILASGGIVHNLREIQWQAREPVAWAKAFNDWMADGVSRGAVDELLDYRERAPSAVRSHPTDEHLEPFFVALGAGGLPARRLELGFVLGSLGMDSYVFG
ncbi:MAG: 4,5-DOPA-extradiol-dioxygenase [Usitatibacter sp.]